MFDLMIPSNILTLLQIKSDQPLSPKESILVAEDKQLQNKLSESLSPMLEKFRFPIASQKYILLQNTELLEELKAIQKVFIEISKSEILDYTENNDIPVYARYGISNLLIWMKNWPDNIPFEIHTTLFEILTIPKIHPPQFSRGLLFFILLKQWPVLATDCNIEQRAFQFFEQNIPQREPKLDFDYIRFIKDFLSEVDDHFQNVLQPALRACSDPRRLLETICRAIQEEVPEQYMFSELRALSGKLRALGENLPNAQKALVSLAEEIDKRVMPAQKFAANLICA